MVNKIKIVNHLKKTIINKEDKIIINQIQIPTIKEVKDIKEF